jgi:TP901 family phage tail tape measure protein
LSSSVADLFVVLDSVTDPFSRGMKKAAADAESESRRMGTALGTVAKVGLGLAVGVVGIGVASVKAATEFQTQMTRLYTAAGAPKAAVEAATGAVLQLGTQVGMTGTQMAEALYHPVSAGLDLATSLQVVKYSAEEAQISGAKLDDTTYALSSVMKAFNEPASQAAQTMADLNAIVGQGDTHFQDFNASVKNWAPTAAAMGISITSIGSAIGYLTDRGNSAEEASTRLTMGLSMMATPSKQAAKLLEGLGVASSDVTGSTDAMTAVLKKTGITQNQLALDLQKPDGIYVALLHLKTALNDAGVHGTEADSAIAKIFGGGRSDKAILSLMQNLDGLKQKFDKVTSDSTPQKFQADWQAASSTFGFQVEQMKVAVENWGIALGTKALPELSSFIATAEGSLGSFFSQFSSGFTGADLKMPTVNFHNAALNDMARQLQQPQTAFERLGQTVHTVLGDVESFGRRLIPIGQDFVTFGLDLWQAGLKIVTALTPTVKLIGVGLFGALELAGKAAANILGPAIKWFADFLASHQTLIRDFAVGVLGTLILKMTILGTLNAAKGIVGLATSIVSFPLSQASQIGDAGKALGAAWSGKEVKDGEQAVKGLKGAFSDLKAAGSNLLDKILPDSGKLAGLAQAGQEVSNIEKAAANGGQLALFETDMQGIVQVAETAPEQLALFDTAILETGTAAATAETETSGLASSLGKFALSAGIIGAAVVGIGLLVTKLASLPSPAQQAATALDNAAAATQKAATGSVQSAADFGKSVASMMESLKQVGPTPGIVATVKGVDQQLAQLVSSGHADQAKQLFDQVAASLQKNGYDATLAAKDLPQYEKALQGAGTAAQTTDTQVQGLQTTLQKQQALTQMTSDFQNLTQTVKANGSVLFGNSQQAIANQQAFQQAAGDVLNYYQQQRNAHVPIQQATSDMLGQVKQLEQTGIAAGMSKGDVDKYLSSLNLLPSQIQTLITADTAPAMYGLSTLLNRINSSSGTVTVYETPGGTVGSTGSGGYKAHALGGPFSAGETAWVGERGPELVTFGASGYVTPNNMLQPAALAGYSGGSGAGGGGPVINNYFITQVAGNVLTEKKLVDVVRTQVLQYNGRNSANGLQIP